jgi:hypothetical protein
MALESQGCRFFWSTATAGATVGAVSTATKVGEITDFNGPSGGAAVIDVTHLESTAVQKLIGLPDEGQFTFSVNFNPTDAGQVALRTDRAARQRRAGVLKFNNAATNAIKFDGYCQTYTPGGSVNGKLQANITLEITGAVSYTTA